MMRIRLRKQVDAIWENENPTNDVDIKKLTRIELLNLKKSLTQIANLQTKISFDFKAGN
jgi:signal-transduction protein with cAMP-binding, CBS, and nucleotidyltransferase domain